MQDTNRFTELERIVNAGLADPHPVARPDDGIRYIAGIRVADQAQRLQIVRSRAEALRGISEQFQRDSTSLVTSLKERNVTPLAVVPTRVWEGICQEAGLIRLSPDTDGKVGLPKIEFSMNHDIAGIVGLTTGVVGVVTGLVVGIGWDTSWGLVPGAIGFPGCFGAAAIAEAIHVWRQRHNTDFLFPKKAEMAGYFVRAKVNLPSAPPEVEEILLRLKDTRLKVAVVPKAIKFGEDHIKIMKDKLRKERAERMRLDPIVYHDFGSATAIVAQYGEFPIEREAVERALDKMLNS